MFFHPQLTHPSRATDPTAPHRSAPHRSAPTCVLVADPVQMPEPVGGRPRGLLRGGGGGGEALEGGGHVAGDAFLFSFLFLHMFGGVRELEEKGMEKTGASSSHSRRTNRSAIVVMHPLHNHLFNQSFQSIHSLIHQSSN